MDTLQILKSAVEQAASDIFIISGLPISYKINGVIKRNTDQKLTPAQTEKFITELYELAKNRDISRFLDNGDDDFSFAVPSVSRFRVNAYKQRGSLAVVIRVITFELPDPDIIGLPKTVMELANRTKGLILVTGPAGSGKTTTLSCIIERINTTRNNHIITLEDPLEYLHRHKLSIVSQREIATDTESYVNALRAALRQSPDVILLGEMRDHETINIAMTAAETGHLIISTLHTVGAANTIDRIIDAFPPKQQQQIRVQLAMILQAVVSQQLIPTVDGGVIPVFEIMIVNGAIRNMIRESKVHQIDSVIYSTANEGSVTMDNSLLELYKKGIISQNDAISFSLNPELMKKKVNG